MRFPSWRKEYGPLVVSALLLVPAVWNLDEGWYADGVVVLVIAAGLLYVAWFVRREGVANTQFLQWLIENREGLRGQGFRYGSRVIDGLTIVTTYRLTFSCLIMTMNFRCAYVLPGDAFHRAKWIQCMVMTLLFGWWGIPHGPFSTIRSLVHNCLGGKKQTLQQILGELDNPPTD